MHEALLLAILFLLVWLWAMRRSKEGFVAKSMVVSEKARERMIQSKSRPSCSKIMTSGAASNAAQARRLQTEWEQQQLSQ